MKSCLILTCLVALNSLNLIAQKSEHSDGVPDNHEHHKNEIGISNAPVYFLKEKSLAYGFHLHYTRNIPKTKLGIGIGYERIFDEHKHNTFGIEAIIRPIEDLSLSVSPCVTFEDKDPVARFALHFETAYEFEIKEFHIGPAIEFAFDQEDYHLSIGLHVGFGF
jgi:hypothetical protein